MLHVSEPSLGPLEEAYVVDALRSSWISSAGAYVDRFEAAFADACGAAHCLTTCNGTTALHLAMLALGLGPGDEVIVPAVSFVATANAVRYVGAEPVFVDVDPASWCIAPDALQAAITPRTRAVVPVHLYGHPAPMDEISEIAAGHRLRVVEDAAEAHLAQYRGRPVGGLGDVGAFSFYGNKILTCGEGGAVLLQDADLAAHVRLLRGQGMDPQRRYFHTVVGYNYRLTNVACAILCAQLERSDEIIRARRGVVACYRALLCGQSVDLQASASDVVPSPWLLTVRLPDPAARERAEAALREASIETRPVFFPLHRLPPYERDATRRGTTCPVAEDLYARGLCLPTHAAMTEDDVERVCSVLGSVSR